MLRQIHIFYNREHIYVKDYAIGFGKTELRNVQDLIKKYMEMPLPGKIITRQISSYQIFHVAKSWHIQLLFDFYALP